jgi:hypothetical protein
MRLLPPCPTKGGNYEATDLEYSASVPDLEYTYMIAIQEGRPHKEFWNKARIE